MSDLERVRVLDGWLPDAVLAVIVLLLVVACAMKSTHRRTESIVGVLSTAAGGVLIWVLSDVLVVFGVGVGWVVMLIVALTIGVLALLVTMIVDSRKGRRILASLLIPLVLVCSALQINRVYGEYSTIASVLGHPEYEQLDFAALHKATMSISQWQLRSRRHTLPSMPQEGIVRTVSIPAEVSGFKARQADVYLPPAALSDEPPALPVMVMMAGQPGSPDHLFSASRIAGMLNTYAASHDGLAPIVVAPDQNGASSHNSLCADTDVYGNAESYLSIDVPNWTKRHLSVASSPKDWLIGGFSQGGTCSTQLGPAHPDIYGHIFAVDGELEPAQSERADTIARYFNADARQYLEHVPTRIIAAHAPSDQTLFTAAGSWDATSQRNQVIIAQAAKQAGMEVNAIVAKRSGHDWHAVRTALAPLIDRFCEQTGIGGPSKPIADYPYVEVVTLQ